MNEHPHAIPQEWLGLYYDGELDATRRAQVQAHLLTCADCRHELNALNALSNVLAGDRLADPALTGRPVQLAWSEFEQRLPERTATGTPLLQWLPGIGLLMANIAVQFIAVLSVGLMFMAGRQGGLASAASWLDRVLSDWLLGWLTWLLPASWSGWGLSLFLVILSAWLAVLYLAWLSSVWLHRQSPVLQPVEMPG